MTVDSVNLFALAQAALHTLSDELAAYGLYVNPGLELRRGAGLLCYYNLPDGHIYLSMPDPAYPRGKFELLILRAAIKLGTDAEILRLLELLVPWLIAHEFAHHLRHQYGLLGEDHWEEERIANQLAGAFIQRSLTAAQQQELLAALAKAMTNLSGSLNAPDDPDGRYPTPDPVGYVYFHLRCLYLDLVEQKITSMAEFVAAHFGQSGSTTLTPSHSY